MTRHTLEAAEKPILDIFCEKYVFRIPSYQRPYAWTTEQTGELLDDVLNACGTAGDVKDQTPYFLGAIVLIKDPQRPEADVVDGQQRLTTLTILLAVLRDIEGGKVGQTIDKRIRLEGDVITGTPDTFLVTTRERDAKFFRELIQAVGATERLPAADAFKDARQSFVGNAAYLRDKLLALTTDYRQRLASYILQRCYLVVVAASDRESAFRIFSVLNSRGLDLSPADVLKADIIGAIPTAEQDNYTEVWEDLEDELGRSRFAELFGHIRMIHRKQKMRGNLVAEFKEFVPALKNPKAFVDQELAPYAEAYLEILEKQFASHAFADQINRFLRILSELDNFDWQPPAIQWIAKNHSNPEIILRFLKDLERLAYGLFLRREDPTDRIARYGKVLSAIEDGSDLYASTSPLQLTDTEKQSILQALDGDIYATTRLRRPILLRLDDALSDGGATYTHSTISVEHVLPQNPSADSQWLRDFPDQAVRDAWVHRLGNLLLLTHGKNAQASNWDFDEKKKRYFSSKAGVTNFALTNTVLREPEWNLSTLQRRQTEMVSKLADVWKLN